MSEQKQINNFISWNFLFKNHKLIAKSNSRNTINWIVDPFTQVKSAEHIAKNQFQMHVLWFFFHDDVKCRKRPWNLINTKISFWRRTFVDHIVQNVPQVQKPVKKTRLSSSKDNFIAKSCLVSTKQKTGYSLELSLSLCVFYQRVFNFEMQNFSLENHHMRNARQPFLWWTQGGGWS